MKPSNNILSLLPKNAGMHNSIYRGEDITDLFYDGTLSKQIENGTFDDIFIGDYIIGKESQRKYLVADIDYRLHCGNVECTKHHILMIPEKIMGKEPMNATDITTGAYIESEMYTTNLDKYKTIIKNDFEDKHILEHTNHFQNTTVNGYSTSGTWYRTKIDLMNECMVYGSYIFTPGVHNQGRDDTVVTNLYTIDKSQLSLFRLKPDSIVALDDKGQRSDWWLRDVVSLKNFARVGYGVNAAISTASTSYGVRPAFLLI